MLAGPKLLREHAVARVFKSALKASGQGVIAVPFWGTGAPDRLGLSHNAPVRVICNLSHPGCNPCVIETLLDRKIRVRSNARLHAKIYATPDAAIVGSSNASSNGLTVEGTAALGWIEANVLSKEPTFVHDVAEMFDELWSDRENTKRVTRAAIAEAKEARAALPPMLFDLPHGTPLFEAAKAAPDAFAKVYVAAYARPLPDDLAADLRSFKSAARLPNTRKAPDFRKSWGLQFEGISKDDWLIDLDCRDRDRPRSWGCARATELKMPYKGRTSMTIAVRGVIEIGGRRFPVTRGEKARLIAAADSILDRAGDRLIPLIDALKLMD